MSLYRGVCILELESSTILTVGSLYGQKTNSTGPLIGNSVWARVSKPYFGQTCELNFLF